MGPEICLWESTNFEKFLRRDVVYFGVDENDYSKLTYYNCVEGQCVEIYNLTCNRTCDAQRFDFTSANVAILQVYMFRVSQLLPKSFLFVSFLTLSSFYEMNENCMWYICFLSVFLLWFACSQLLFNQMFSFNLLLNLNQFFHKTHEKA